MTRLVSSWGSTLILPRSKLCSSSSRNSGWRNPQLLLPSLPTYIYNMKLITRWSWSIYMASKLESSRTDRSRLQVMNYNSWPWAMTCKCFHRLTTRQDRIYVYMTVSSAVFLRSRHGFNRGVSIVRSPAWPDLAFTLPSLLTNLLVVGYVHVRNIHVHVYMTGSLQRRSQCTVNLAIIRMAGCLNYILVDLWFDILIG